MSESDNLEVEVKFIVPALEELRGRLLAAGATQKRARQLERNVRYDTPQEELRHQEQLLRLRQDDRIRLTFKSAALEQPGSEAKVREELEVTVSDFERMEGILRRLGFLPCQVYEKYRETFVLHGVEVVLDEMPFGDFIELEGEEASIRAVASELDLSWKERILDNYLNLMARVKRHYQLPFDDVTFANFRGRNIDLEAVLSR